MSDLKLKTLGVLREFRPGMDVETYLTEELRQNWKALQQFVSDASKFATDIQSSVTDLAPSHSIKTTKLISSYNVNTAAFTTVESITVNTSSTRIKAIFEPFKGTMTTISPCIRVDGSSAVSDIGVYLRIRESVTNEVVYQGMVTTRNTAAGSSTFRSSPVLWGEIDITPGEHTFILEARNFNGSSTDGAILNYNFTIEEL